MDRSIVINLKALGPERIRTSIRSGQNQMPAFTDATLPERQLDGLLAYLENPSAGAAASGPPRPALPQIDGLVRYFGPLGTMFRAANGLPAIKPPWAQIVAYDLNSGTIKWRAPLGSVRALASQGITGTGNAERIHRNGLVVTAGRLLFAGSWGDATLRAFDTDTGAVLWERVLEANPEGLPAVFEIAGRQYIAFCASASGPPSPGNIAFVGGKSEAQGYYVFALPQRTSSE